jgi:hypothetical protein
MPRLTPVHMGANAAVNASLACFVAIVRLVTAVLIRLIARNAHTQAIHISASIVTTVPIVFLARIAAVAPT